MNFLVICFIGAVLLEPPLAWANNLAPKVYVDVESVSLIDPLKHGFHVVFFPEFVAHYLNPARLPTIYAMALPLRPNTDQGETRRMLYREDILDNMLMLDGLEEKSWYYICVEFENVVRRHNLGNTSTTCRLARTLDKFGKSEPSIVANDYKIAHIGSESMEFQVHVDTDFPLQIRAFLEHGSAPVQTYILSQPKSLRIHFPLLSPGFNYGRLCIIEDPLVHPYTMMGRSAHATIRTCHLDDLKTKDAKKPLMEMAMADRPTEDRPQANLLRDPARNVASPPSGGKLSIFHVIWAAMLTCLVINVLLPVVPLAYIVCSSS